MQIDFSRELMNFDGEPLKESQVVNLVEEANGNIKKVVLQGKPLTLKTACVNAVASKYEGENLTPEQHVSRFLLAGKIQKSNGAGLELESDDVVLIKTLLAKTNYLPIVVGQACQLLEGKEV